MARIKGETKPERIARAVAEAVQAGKEWQLPSVDFNDPNRPPTCLEVDFPILPINHVAAIEGNAGKPIYQMSKWWARRRSSVFRSMLIAAATKAPDDRGEAAKLVWDAYYGNHQKNKAFRNLKVADIFMGGGTTIVEGARLGMQMYGNDLNPVAWFVVKNELAQVDPADVQKLLDQIEAEVNPQIMPFYACDCPRGHKGKWTHKQSNRVMGPDFDPLALTPDQRPEYEYEGPEVIYTFWSKHGPCQSTECGHRTPIISSPVVAMKTLTVKAWAGVQCEACEKTFDLEEQCARMAPAALFVVSPEEGLYAILDDKRDAACPHCEVKRKPPVGSTSKNKSVELTLLVHPDWLKGAPGKSTSGLPFGGSVTDDAESTARWNAERAKSLKLIEVRGALPEEFECPDTHELVRTGDKGGTVPKKSAFECKAATCGRVQDVLESVEAFGKTAPASAYMIQGVCPACKKLGLPYDGRFFHVADKPQLLDSAGRQWESDSGLLKRYAPVGDVPRGLETSVRTPLHKYHYKKWCEFFNHRQLVVHASFMRAILEAKGFSDTIKFYMLGAFQQYLRNNSMFCIWNVQRDTTEPFFSKNNYQPPNRPVENGVYHPLGRGNWSSCSSVLFETLAWLSTPWELVSKKNLSSTHPSLAEEFGNSKSAKVYPGDSIYAQPIISCGTSTSLNAISDGSHDLVITDPPFGDILQYAEFSAFFYAWLKPAMDRLGICQFTPTQPPTALEAVENSQRQGKEAANFYSRLLSGCWMEAARILKPSGILAFTFHHDKDGPWVAVLESLFNAGFYLEATFPVRSDETKGEGGTPGTFGAQKVEYDIIHVCRKRTAEPTEVSWARLRRQINQDVRQLQDILSQHQTSGMQEADLQVIRRGKALEYYSKHYGKVYVEKGREFTVREALLAINQLLDDQADTTMEAPPVLAEPYTRQFFRLFADKTNEPRDQMQKYLRGTGVSPQEFIDRGWCEEKSKVFYPISPLEWAKSLRGVRRDAMSRDFDQVMYMTGACCDGSGIKLSDTLDNPSFKPHPATESLLDWITRHGGSPVIKNAARIALQLYRSWVAKNQKKVQEERTLFDLVDEGV